MMRLILKMLCTNRNATSVMASGTSIPCSRSLAAYNAGRGNVQDWILEYGWPRDFHDVDAIPYQETREYVKRVLMNERKYRELYP